MSKSSAMVTSSARKVCSSTLSLVGESSAEFLCTKYPVQMTLSLRSGKTNRSSSMQKERSTLRLGGVTLIACAGHSTSSLLKTAVFERSEIVQLGALVSRPVTL